MTMIGKLLNVAQSLGVRVTTQILPGDLLGAYMHETRRVLLEARTTPFEKCVVLAHELGHAHHGHSCRNGFHDSNPLHEWRADRFAAGLLIDGSELARLEQISGDPDFLAEELGVTVDFLAWYQRHYLTKLESSTYAGAREGLGQFDYRQDHDKLTA